MCYYMMEIVTATMYALSIVRCKLFLITSRLLFRKRCS
uniref:Uncharacterized protein n=1 Tax=Acinetobacter phage vB_Ab_1137_KEN_02 TaxID=3143013 RepID=A0AAU8KX79_9VIRU